MSKKALLTFILLVMTLLALYACSSHTGGAMPGQLSTGTPAIAAVATAPMSTPEATATSATAPTVEPAATEPPTATPEPTPAAVPSPTYVLAPGYYRDYPYTRNDLAVARWWNIAVLDVVRGDEAWAMLQAASPLNEPPPAGMQYVLVRLRATSTDTGSRLNVISQGDFGLTSDRGLLYDNAPVVVPQPALDADLLRGEATEGWVAFMAGQDEGQLMLVVDVALDAVVDHYRFVALDEGAAIHFDYLTSWNMSPTDTGTTRANPAPPGRPVRTYDWEVTVTEVLRGEAAWAAVQAASPANEPPPEGMEYVAAKLSVWRWGAGDYPRALNGSAFSLSGEDNVLHHRPAVVAPSPALDVEVFSGGRVEGWIVRMARVGEEQLMLRFEPPYGLTANTIRYLALSEGASAVAPPELADLEPDGPSHYLTQPAPFGQTLITEDWELTVLEVVRGGAALALVPPGNPYNELPAPGMEFIPVKLRARNISTVDEPALMFDQHFSTIDETKVYFDPPADEEPEPALDVYLYPGGEYEGWVMLQTRQSSVAPVLVFLPWPSTRAYYMSLIP